jgi:hypothetical protein
VIQSSNGLPLSVPAQKIGVAVDQQLCRYYPAFKGFWLVQVNEIGGTIEVINTALSGRMGFLMHTAKIDPELKKVVMAGGELLERYRVVRDRALTERKFLETTNNLRTLEADCG